MTTALVSPSTKRKRSAIDRLTNHKPANRRLMSRAQPEPKKLDRFELGWRDITRITENGEVVYERQPLTLWDILHPQVGDFRVHTDDHEQFCNYLLNVFKAQVRSIPGAYVLHDTRVAWAAPGIIPHGPDVAVIFNVRAKDNWATFDEAEEGTRPSLVIEIVSPKTRRVDVTDKFEEYAQSGLEYYVIVDAHIRRGYTYYSLIGYRLITGVYQPVTPNEKGWLWLEPVQVWLGIDQNRLVCFDKDGQAIGDYVEVVQQNEIAIQVARDAYQRADSAEQRADAESKKRLALEVELEEMKEELRRLRGLN